MPFADIISSMERFVMRKSFVAILFLYSVLNTLVEGLGLGLVLPIAQLMISGGDPQQLVASSKIWQVLELVYQFVGVPLGIFSLFATCAILIIARQLLCF